MHIGFFKVLGLVGLLAQELTLAATDGKITAREALRIMEKVCDALGIDLDTTGISVAEEKNEA